MMAGLRVRRIGGSRLRRNLDLHQCFPPLA